MHNSQNNHTTHLLLTVDGGAMSKPEKQKRLFYSMQLINQGGMIFPTPPLLLSHNLEVPSSSFPISCRVNAGLIYINSVRHGDLFPADGLDRVHIFNPCTRECITLPVSEYDSVPVPIFDEYNTYDIGFSSLTNEYKVLEIHVRWLASESPGADESFVFKIFTLGTTTSWRDVQQEIDVFDDLALDSLFFYKIEVNGCLALYTRDLLNERVMELRILKDYQNQVWVKESIIFPDKWEKLGQPIPLCSFHIGELLLRQTRQSIQGSDRSVHLYDMKAKTYKKVEITVPGLVIASYDETIVSLR
ncbi:hypothetical protein M0R45_034951 [Rubus argutus]